MPDDEIQKNLEIHECKQCNRTSNDTPYRFPIFDFTRNLDTWLSVGDATETVSTDDAEAVTVWHSLARALRSRSYRTCLAHTPHALTGSNNRILLQLETKIQENRQVWAAEILAAMITINEAIL